MNNKSIKVLVLQLFCFIIFVACNVSESYLITNQSNLRIIERQDHQKCISQGFDLGEWDDISTEMYWRCRYNLAQERMITDPISAESIQNNAQIKLISEEILKKLNRAKQSNLARIEDDIQTMDHARCVKQGYNLDDIDRVGINEYYLCRQKLVLDRIMPAPSVTNSYEASILSKNKFNQYLQDLAANKKPDQQVLLVNEMMSKYPLCSGLNIRSEDFKKCVDAQEEAKRCLASIETVKFKKQLEDKIYCQEQAFIQFPDNYSLAREKSSEVIAKLDREQKDREDQLKKAEHNSLTLKFLSGGLTKDIETRNGSFDSKFGQFPGQLKSTNNLYSKIELLKLREQFINRCMVVTEEKLPIFVERVSDDCRNIATNWDQEN